MVCSRCPATDFPISGGTRVSSFPGSGSARPAAIHPHPQNEKYSSPENNLFIGQGPVLMAAALTIPDRGKMITERCRWYPTGGLCLP